MLFCILYNRPIPQSLPYIPSLKYTATSRCFNITIKKTEYSFNLWPISRSLLVLFLDSYTTVWLTFTHNYHYILNVISSGSYSMLCIYRFGLPQLFLFFFLYLWKGRIARVCNDIIQVWHQLIVVGSWRILSKISNSFVLKNLLFKFCPNAFYLLFFNIQNEKSFSKIIC